MTIIDSGLLFWAAL